MARLGDNGIFSTLQLAFTCWVVNRLQAIILSIQYGVHAEKSSGGNRDGINPPGASFSLMERSDSESSKWTRERQGHNIHRTKKLLIFANSLLGIKQSCKHELGIEWDLAATLPRHTTQPPS